jgi:hypothetical protein
MSSGLTPEQAESFVLDRGRFEGRTVREVDLMPGGRGYLVSILGSWQRYPRTRDAIELYLRTHPEKPKREPEPFQS